MRWLTITVAVVAALLLLALLCRAAAAANDTSALPAAGSGIPIEASAALQRAFALARNQ